MSNGTASENLGRLFLRLSIGILMILHGVHKFIVADGFAPVKAMLEAKGLPVWLWLGVPVGEVIAPLLLLFGVATRISSAFVALTMIFAIYLAFGSSAFGLNDNGGFNAELPLLFLFSSLALMCFGAGNYALYNGENKWLK